jgi:hypothetical protein
MLGWREHAVVSASECVLVDGTLPDPAACLAQGVTSYGALTRAARGIVQRRIAALDAEIARLTTLRDQLATRIGAEPVKATGNCGLRRFPGIADEFLRGVLPQVHARCLYRFV